MKRRLWVSLALAGALFPFATRLSRAAGDKDRPMRRIFITGSTDGLGRASADTLIGEGYQVVLHARSKPRAAALKYLAPR